MSHFTLSLYTAVNQVQLKLLYDVLKKFIDKNTFIILKTRVVCYMALIKQRQKEAFQRKLFFFLMLHAKKVESEAIHTSNVTVHKKMR